MIKQTFQSKLIRIDTQKLIRIDSNQCELVELKRIKSLLKKLEKTILFIISYI